MAYWNHFSKRRYAEILFSSVKVGEKFRQDKFDKNGRRRKDIIMVKTGKLEYQEFRNKRKYSVYHSDFNVSSFAI